MMKTEYRRDLRHTWMILSGGNVPDEEAYPVRMLTENQIGGLLSCTAARLNGELRFYYDITALYSLKTILEAEPAGKNLLEQIFASLAVMTERLGEYLLDPDGLLLDPAYVYFNTEQNGICFCWYPGKDMSFQEQAGILGRALLPHLAQTDKAGVIMGYGFYQQCTAGTVTPEVLRSLLRRETAAEQEEHPVTREELERSVLPDSIFDEPEEEEPFFGKAGSRIRNWFGKKQNPEDQKKETAAEKKNSGKKRIKEEKTFSQRQSKRLYGRKQEEASYCREQPEDREEGRTMLLSEDMLAYKAEKPSRLVIREPSGEEQTLSLTEEKYLIGKRDSGAGLQLQSPTVSRLHARLVKTGKGWILCDLNSRNGTFLNNDADPLLPEQEILLEDGDRIRFADVYCTYYEE